MVPCRHWPISTIWHWLTEFVEQLLLSSLFLRIQNIALGYTLPKNWLKKLKIENARIYANIKNVYTFTGYDGYDPEIGSTQAQYSYSGQSMLMYGVDTGRCPSPRIYTFGIDLTF